ncbi:LexA family protein [Zooshikella sp. RANM57]|uniref:LexA family protein n=1 Tax=Zooshikella sp. RANM57 TaxID=3425863 RepID=UPI003D6DF243
MIGDRVKLAREHFSLTQDELASTINISQTAIYKIEDGLTQNPRCLGKLAEVLRVSPEWLQFGINPPAWLKESQHTTEAINDIETGYPLLSWVQAGAWQPIDEVELYEAKRLCCPVKCSVDTFVLRVQGISMEPMFHEDDLIFVDPNVECRSGSFIIARLDDHNEATFKQLIIEGGQRYLKPLNPDWPEKIIPLKGSSCSVVGTVIFAGRAFA